MRAPDTPAMTNTVTSGQARARIQPTPAAIATRRDGACSAELSSLIR